MDNAATDAPVEERHRRAAWTAIYGEKTLFVIQNWFADGGSWPLVSLDRHAQSLANAERDGRASRDAEVAELRVYKRAWHAQGAWLADEIANGCGSHRAGYRVVVDERECILAYELARKETP